MSSNLIGASPKATFGCLRIRWASILVSFGPVVAIGLLIGGVIYHAIRRRNFLATDAILIVALLALLGGYLTTIYRAYKTGKVASRLNVAIGIQAVFFLIYVAGLFASIWNAVVPLGNEDEYLFDLLAVYLPLEYLVEIGWVSMTTALRAVAVAPIVLFGCFALYSALVVYTFRCFKDYLDAKKRTAIASQRLLNEIREVIDRQMEEDARSGHCMCV
ncbi:hypothetical protein AAVH_27284 [Aphelenchoides avenae]|nr:hypothetical protein AAVH_27284 [Aphelenchus avenae]